MPSYEYEVADTGERIELVMSVDEMERKQKRDGTIRLPDGRKAFRVFSTCGAPATAWARGHRSQALGFVLDPDNPAAAAKEAAGHEQWLRQQTGCAQIQVDRRTGEVITYSQKQKVAAARARGMVDLDGAYNA